MSVSNFEYRVRLGADRTEVFRYDIEDEGFLLANVTADSAPNWTELGFSQCPNCPLSADEHPHCPVALQLHGLVSRFEGTRSIDMVVVEAITPTRRVRKKAALQDVLASILDLVLPICGCPVTEVMKPLSRFHLPLASDEETIFRVTGMYLLHQYFQSQNSDAAGSPPFAGLDDIYKGLHQLNTAVAQRLQNATRSDSVKNAVALVDMYSLLIPVLLEDRLAELREFFGIEATVGQSPSAGNLKRAKEFRREPTLDNSTDGGGRPAWLRSIAGGGRDMMAGEADPEAKIAELLEKADSLSLEPLEADEPTETDKPSETDVSRRAVYKLSDD